MTKLFQPNRSVPPKRHYPSDALLFTLPYTYDEQQEMRGALLSSLCEIIRLRREIRNLNEQLEEYTEETAIVSTVTPAGNPNGLL